MTEDYTPPERTKTAYQIYTEHVSSLDYLKSILIDTWFILNLKFTPIEKRGAS